MNKGLRNYTKQLTQTFNGASVSVNINEADANMHIIIPLLETVGHSSFKVGLIYNHQGNDVVDSLFGKGFRLDFYSKVEDNGFNVSVEKPDGSSDDYVDLERNIETGLLMDRLTDISGTVTGYRFKNKKGYYVQYGNNSLDYPQTVVTSASTITSDFDSTEKTISNAYDDVIRFISGNSSRISTINYYHDNEILSSASLTYTKDKISTVTVTKQEAVVSKIVITYGESDITVTDDISKQAVKYYFADGKVTSFTEGFDGTFISERTVSIKYDGNKSCVSDTLGNSQWTFFDSNGIPLYDLDSDGFAQESEFDTQNKRLLAVSNPIPTVNRLSGLISSDLSQFTQNGVTVELKESEESEESEEKTVNQIFASILNGSLYTVATSGSSVHELSYTKNYAGKADEDLTLVIFGKQSVPESSCKVSVSMQLCDSSGNIIGYDSDHFKKTTADDNFDFLTLGVNAKKAFSSIKITVALEGSGSIELGGLQLINRQYGIAYTYDSVGNCTEIDAGKMLAMMYNSANYLDSICDSSTYVQNTYNTNKKVEKSIAPYGVTTTYTYDNTCSDNLLKTTVTKNGATQKIETEQAYDSTGRFMASQKDELGYETQYFRDSLGRIKNVTDALGNIHSVITNAETDLVDQALIEEIVNNYTGETAELGKITYQYDARRRTASAALNNGAAYGFTYDSYNNITGISLNGTALYTFTYDNYGRVLTCTSGSSTNRVSYDSHSRVTDVYYKASDSAAEQLKFTYTYDSLNQLEKVTDDIGNILISYVYDSYGKVTSTVSGGTTVNNVYNEMDEAVMKSRVRSDGTLTQSLNTTSRSRSSHSLSLVSAFGDNSLLAMFEGNSHLMGSSEYQYYLYADSEYTFGKTNTLSYVSVQNTRINYRLTPTSSRQNPEKGGAVQFWFNPDDISRNEPLICIKNESNQVIEIYKDEGKIKLGSSINGAEMYASDPNIKSGWNFLAFSWIQKETEDGGAYSAFTLRLNELYSLIDTSGSAHFDNVSEDMYYDIGGTLDGEYFHGKFACLCITPYAQVTIDDIERFYRISRINILENGINENGLLTVDYGTSAVYNVDNNKLFPLHGSLNSTTGIAPVKYEPYTNSKMDKLRSFVFNNQVKQYVYIADGAPLEYDFGLGKDFSIMMRAYIECNMGKQYFFETKFGTQKIGLYRNNLGNLAINYNGTQINTLLQITNNSWHNVGFSISQYLESSGGGDILSVAALQPIGQYVQVMHIYLDGVSRSIEKTTTAIWTPSTTCIGRASSKVADAISDIGNEGYCPLHGYIEMLTAVNYVYETGFGTAFASTACISKTSELDEFGMLRRECLHKHGTPIYTHTYDYRTRENANYISPIVKTDNFSIGTQSIVRNYTIDKLHRVTTIQDSVFGSKTYTYDGLGRLTNDNGLAITYDNSGNILTLGSTNLIYDTTVKNKLTRADGNVVLYSSTNPWQISSYMGKSYQYQGNRLTQYSNGSNVYSYTYNHLGQRITKTTGTDVTQYVYDGDMLITEISPTYQLDFLYDENGKLYGFVKDNSSKYYYIRDSLCNILGIIDESGTIVGKYSATAYGTVTITLDTGGIATLNPFRYKGYYYDSESGMYYCNARYYIPEWGRWLTPDSPDYLQFDQITGFNNFAYCINDPVNYSDGSGHSPEWWEWVLAGVAVAGLIVGAILTGGTLLSAAFAGATIGAGISLGTQALSGELNWAQFALDTGVGAISGLIGGSGVSRSAATLLGGVVGSGSNLASQLISGTSWENISFMQVMFAGAIGAASGYIGGAGARNKTAINQDKDVQSATKQLNKVIRRIANGYRYRSVTAAQSAFSNTMDGLATAISSQMGRMFETAMVSYGVSTVASNIINSYCDANGYWFF